MVRSSAYWRDVPMTPAVSANDSGAEVARTAIWLGCCPLMCGPPAAVQALAIRDEQRLTGGVVRANGNRSRDVGGAVARDHDGRKARGGRRAQPGCGTRNGQRVLGGYPELPQGILVGLTIRHRLLDVVSVHDRFDQAIADELSYQRLGPAPGAICHHAHPTPAANASITKATKPAPGERLAAR